MFPHPIAIALDFGDFLALDVLDRSSTIAGIHLRLPGCGGADGPTLEILEHSRIAAGPPPAVNRLPTDVDGEA